MLFETFSIRMPGSVASAYMICFVLFGRWRYMQHAFNESSLHVRYEVRPSTVLFAKYIFNYEYIHSSGCGQNICRSYNGGVFIHVLAVHKIYSIRAGDSARKCWRAKASCHIGRFTGKMAARAFPHKNQHIYEYILLMNASHSLTLKHTYKLQTHMCFGRAKFLCECTRSVRECLRKV